jgi:DNA-binding NtrC family response regulator
MCELSQRLDRIASSALPVLITGETGTGKELVARAIHLRSERRNQAFVSENCAALTETLLESELFGHEQGSFTGAAGRREGLFHRADGGTLFIDEVGDMPLVMQGKLLRVLQEGEVRRVGGQESEPVDVRVIAATHRDLRQLVEEGRFRKDLLYRLAILDAHVPALRDRLIDVPALAANCLQEVARETGDAPRALSEEALDALLAHDWPGNVRELHNAIRVGALFSSSDTLEATALPLRGAPQFGSPRKTASPAPTGGGSYLELLDDFESRERRYVSDAIARARGRKTEAARRLGITRYALYRVMRRLGIDSNGEPKHSGSDRLAEAVTA